MGSHVVATADDLPPGERVLAGVDGTEVGVFNVDGEYYAYANECPRQGGPVCEGQIGGLMETSLDPETGARESEWVKEGRILACPWCSWQFDLVSGRCESNEAAELTARDVRVEDGRILVAV